VSDRLDAMTKAARDALACMDEAQRARALKPLDDDADRRTWFYTPGPRAGLPLADVSASQSMAVHKLVASALSLHGYAKVTAIVALEHVLDEIEGGHRGRDPGLYYLTVYGEPGSDAWGWRFEGHHVSVNVTVSDGEVASTPLFLGANPAAVRHGGAIVLRPLGEEEDAARALLSELDPGRLTAAVVSEEAPPDILTSNDPRVDPSVLSGGIAASDLTSAQRDALVRLVDAYLGRLPAVLAPSVDVDGLSFAWAGPVEPGKPHYYRVWGPRFLAEYDNTQDDANHVHAVWRDPSGDFGEDLLRRHLRQEHGA
jgi:hypothetical protein